MNTGMTKFHFCRTGAPLAHHHEWQPERLLAIPVKESALIERRYNGSSHCRRPLLCKKFHAIIGQALLDLGDVVAVARLHGHQHVNP